MTGCTRAISLKERAQLALHPFLRRRWRLSRVCRAVVPRPTACATCTYQIGAIVRITAVERRSVRTGAAARRSPREPAGSASAPARRLRTAAARDGRPFAAGHELLEEVLDQARLADARLPVTAAMRPRALLHAGVRALELGALALAADGRPAGDRYGRCRIAAGGPRRSASSTSTSRADGRRDGSLSSICCTNSSNNRGIAGLRRPSGTGDRSAMLAMTATCDDPSNGLARRPSRRARRRGRRCRTGPDMCPLRRLGRHVGGRAGKRPRHAFRFVWCVSVRRGLRRCHRASPKSRTLTYAVAPNHHVLGLDVAMHDAGGVGRRERARNLTCRRPSPCRAASARGAASASSQRLAVDQLLHDE